MPATMFGTPVERCAATTSAIGIAAYLIAAPSVFVHRQVEEATGCRRSSPCSTAKPPAASACAMLRVAARLRPSFCVASDNRSEVGFGIRRAVCAARHSPNTTP
jgi:hypothetical protein